MRIRGITRPVVTTVFVTMIVVGGAFWPSPGIAAWLSAKTVLMVPGNNDPDGAGIEAKLNGHFDHKGPNFAFPGYDTVKVPWLSDSFDFDPGYAVSQADGLNRLHTAVTLYRDIEDGDDVDRMVIVGYSSGAVVVIEEMKQLDATEALSPEQVEFYVFGSPHRPNGGIYARFPGLAIGDVVFAGPNPDTRYELTDIGYEYDPVSDFPAYPLMPLTLINAVMGFQELHVNYVGPESDPDNALDDPNMTYYDQTRGISYVTIAAPHLPILMPLYRMIDDVPVLRPFVEPVLKLVEPALKVLVDLGYRRDVPVGEPVPAGLFPRIDLAKLVADLAHSVVAGVNDAVASITGSPAPGSPPTAPVAPLAPHATAVEAPGPDAAAQPAGTGDSVQTQPGKTSRSKAVKRGELADPDEASARERSGRPHTTAGVSDGAADNAEQPGRRKDATTDTRPGRATTTERASTAKMDSVRSPNRRQSADAA